MHLGWKGKVGFPRREKLYLRWLRELRGHLGSTEPGPELEVEQVAGEQQVRITEGPVRSQFPFPVLYFV